MEKRAGRRRAATVGRAVPGVACLSGGDSLVGLLALALSLSIYSATLAPGLTAGDSGELATAAALGGLAHPPGYPLWTATANGWVRLLGRLGVDEPVLATNILSALLTALAAAAAAGLLRRLTGSDLAALAAAMMLAVSRPVWSAAVVTEVYALSLLLLVLLASVVLRRPPEAAGAGKLFTAGGLVGLGLVGHQVFALVVPIVLPWFWRAARSHPARRGVWAVAGLIVGLGPIVLLFSQAEASTLLRWGWTGDLAGLWRFLGRGSYEPLAASGSLAHMPARAWLLLRAVGEAVSPTGLLLAFGGLWLIWRRGSLNAAPNFPRALASAAAAVVAIWLVALPLAVPFPPTAAGAAGMRPFLYPAIVALTMGWAGLFAAALRWARVRGPRTSALVRLATLFLPLVLTWTHWPYQDRRADHAAMLYAEDLLRCVPDSATLVVEGDNEAFPLLYLQAVHGRRPDVTVRHRRGVVFAAGPDLYHVAPRNREAAVREVEAHYLADRAADPNGWTGVTYATYVELSAETGVTLMPRGLVYLVYRDTARSLATQMADDTSDPLAWLAQQPDGAGARFLDHVTRRLLLAYPVARARRAALVGDLPAQAAALHALACLGHDVPEVQAWLAQGTTRLGPGRPALRRRRRRAQLSP